MQKIKRTLGSVSAVLVATVLTFGAAQAFASADTSETLFCFPSCPPLTGGVDGTCWDECVDSSYVGGDCDPSGDCCCFEK